MLDTKMSYTSPVVCVPKSQFAANPFRACQNCSRLSSSFCFLYRNLWQSMSVFRFFWKASLHSLSRSLKLGVFISMSGFRSSSVFYAASLECTGNPYLLKAQHSAFNISDSTTIPLTVQNWQITSFVPDSTDFVVDSSNKHLAVRTVGMQRCPGFHKNVSFAK